MAGKGEQRRRPIGEHHEPSSEAARGKGRHVKPNAELLACCEQALELLLGQRGNPSVEIDQVLSEDPRRVFAQKPASRLNRRLKRRLAMILPATHAAGATAG